MRRGNTALSSTSTTHATGAPPSGWPSSPACGRRRASATAAVTTAWTAPSSSRSRARRPAHALRGRRVGGGQGADRALVRRLSHARRPAAKIGSRIADLAARRARTGRARAKALTFGVAAYVVCRDTDAEVECELARITALRPGAPGSRTSRNGWRHEARGAAQDRGLFVSNRGLRRGSSARRTPSPSASWSSERAGVDLAAAAVQPAGRGDGALRARRHAPRCGAARAGDARRGAVTSRAGARPRPSAPGRGVSRASAQYRDPRTRFPAREGCGPRRHGRDKVAPRCASRTEKIPGCSSSGDRDPQAQSSRRAPQRQPSLRVRLAAILAQVKAEVRRRNAPTRRRRPRPSPRRATSRRRGERLLRAPRRNAGMTSRAKALHLLFLRAELQQQQVHARALELHDALGDGVRRADEPARKSPGWTPNSPRS